MNQRRLEEYPRPGGAEDRREPFFAAGVQGDQRFPAFEGVAQGLDFDSLTRAKESKKESSIGCWRTRRVCSIYTSTAKSAWTCCWKFWTTWQPCDACRCTIRRRWRSPSKKLTRCWLPTLSSLKCASWSWKWISPMTSRCFTCLSVDSRIFRIFLQILNHLEKLRELIIVNKNPTVVSNVMAHAIKQSRRSDSAQSWSRRSAFRRCSATNSPPSTATALSSPTELQKLLIDLNFLRNQRDEFAGSDWKRSASACYATIFSFKFNQTFVLLSTQKLQAITNN